MVVRSSSRFEGKQGEAQALRKERLGGEKIGQADERRGVWSVAALLRRCKNGKRIERVVGSHLRWRQWISCRLVTQSCEDLGKGERQFAAETGEEFGEAGGSYFAENCGLGEELE